MRFLLLINSLASAYYDLLNRFSGSYTRRILLEALQLLGQLWPYLVVGIILSTLVKTFISKQRMADFFSKRNHTATILLASMIEVASPIGSYIIIPMSAALLGIGVPLSALMVLMVSSPLINPNLFVLTAGAMGIEMAILRVVAAFILGSIAGYTTLWLERLKILYPGSVLKDNQLFSMEHFTDTGKERTMRGFLLELYKMARYVSKFFFLAIILAAAIKIQLIRA